MTRQLNLYTPELDGKQKLLIRKLEGREGISELFAYQVTLYSASDEVDFSKVLGQEMSIGLLQPRGEGGKSEKERFFHGYVSAFSSIGTEGGFHLYSAELRPNLWRLTRSINCRAFQGLAVPDIVTAVLKDHGITDVPAVWSRNYLPWEYCVQYRESDFAFISRLMEREGIHYFFKHEKGKHTLCLADANTNEPTKGYEDVPFKLDQSHHPGVETVWSLSLSKHVLTDRTTLTDYDFTKPTQPLLRSSGSEVERKHDDAADYEAYEHLETVVQQTGYDPALTEEYARIRTEEIHSQYAVIHCETDARGLAAGHSFKLKEHRTTARNGEYLLLSTQLTAEIDERSSNGSAGGTMVYRSSFEAIDAKVPFRPARVTPKPRVPGPQSATVAGPSGPHYTDQWGRVFVKFHWYRPPGPAGDKDISCWIRVSQNSAGANWGSMFVPHIGQEVIVSFYEGDPDRPVITGRVYNGNNKPPLDLPANAYKSIIRDHFGNELIFDGTPGTENVILRSPFENSMIKMGTDGLAEFTRNRKATYAYDTESYAFGQKISYTKGWSWSVDRGFWGSVKAGAGFGMTVGTETKVGMGANLEFKGGVAISYVMNTSLSWGYGREFKSTTGTYKRMAKGDAILDSQKTAFVTGGKNDNTMLASNDGELVLSYDDSNKQRGAAIAKADARAKAGAATVASMAATLSVFGAAWYQTDVDRTGEQKDPNSDVWKIHMDHARVSGMSKGDIPIGIAAVGSSVAAVLATKSIDVESPKHSSPSAKIVLTKNLVRVFAGKDKEAQLEMTKSSGFALTTKKKIELTADKELNFKAGTVIKLEAANAILMKSAISHKNWTVAK